MQGYFGFILFFSFTIRLRADLQVQVTVLESRGRIGGRIHTDFSNGYPVDMGASW